MPLLRGDGLAKGISEDGLSDEVTAPQLEVKGTTASLTRWRPRMKYKGRRPLWRGDGPATPPRWRFLTISDDPGGSFEVEWECPRITQIHENKRVNRVGPQTKSRVRETIGTAASITQEVTAPLINHGVGFPYVKWRPFVFWEKRRGRGRPWRVLADANGRTGLTWGYKPNTQTLVLQFSHDSLGADTHIENVNK